MKCNVIWLNHFYCHICSNKKIVSLGVLVILYHSSVISLNLLIFYLIVALLYDVSSLSSVQMTYLLIYSCWYCLTWFIYFREAVLIVFFTYFMYSSLPDLWLVLTFCSILTSPVLTESIFALARLSYFLHLERNIFILGVLISYYLIAKGFIWAYDVMA